MSEKPAAVESKPSSRAVKIRKVMAIATTFMAAGGIAAPVAHAEGFAKSPPKKEVVHKGLEKVSALPGYKINVGPEMRKQLMDSTVEVIKHNPPNADTAPMPWFGNCTGVKVLMPGQMDPMIMTAAHCFSEATGIKYGDFANPAAPTDTAENFMNAEYYEVGIVDPQSPWSTREQGPLLGIGGISISTHHKDVALLSPFTGKGGPSPSGQDSRTFEQIPAINFKVAEHLAPGEQVALYGVPQAANFTPVIGTGRYIGRVHFSEYVYDTGPETSSRMLDIVAVNPNNPTADACNFGASGSLAMRSDGSMLGPLSIRLNKGYSTPNTNQALDSPNFNNYWRTEWEMETGIDLENYSTICAYTVLDQNTPAELVEGFSHMAPPMGK